MCSTQILNVYYPDSGKLECILKVSENIIIGDSTQLVRDCAIWGEVRLLTAVLCILPMYLNRKYANSAILTIKSWSLSD